MAKLRKSLPTMDEHADELHPTAPPATTPATASPSMNDARATQRKIMGEKMTGPQGGGGQRFPNPFTAVSDVVSGISSSLNKRRR